MRISDWSSDVCSSDLGSSSCFRMSICLIIKQKPGPVCPWRVVCRTTGFVGRLELPGGTARRRGSFKNDNGQGVRHEGTERQHPPQDRKSEVQGKRLAERGKDRGGQNMNRKKKTVV